MKQWDIEIDRTYTNGKGRYRKVLDMGDFGCGSARRDVKYHPTRDSKKGEVVDRNALDWHRSERANFGKCTL